MWYLIWHKHKAQKEIAFFWLVLNNAAVVNEWEGRIPSMIGKSGTHCGPHHVDHRFFNCPLAQHVWHYVVDIIWQFLLRDLVTLTS